MDYKANIIACVERIPEDNTQALKRLYDMAKKEASRTRCAPRCDLRDRENRDILDQLLALNGILKK